MTMPLSETVATSGLLLFQVRVPVDPAGRKAGPRFQTSPAWDREKSFRFRVKEVAVWLAGMVPEGSGERVGSTPPVGAGLALESGEPVGAAELDVTGGLEGWLEFRLLPRLTRGLTTETTIQTAATISPRDTTVPTMRRGPQPPPP